MPNPATSVSREIATLRRSLKARDRSLQRLNPDLRVALSRTQGAGPALTRRKLNLSPKRLAQLKLQGKYMAHLRSLKPRQKAEVKRLLGKMGMRAAVVRAKQLTVKRAA